MPAAILLTLVFLISYAPWQLGEHELSWREGYVVAQAQGVQFDPLPVVTAHGEAIPNVQPLLPLLARGLIELGCPAELSGRVLSLLALASLAVIVFTVTCRTRNCPAAGACAGAMLISSILALDKTQEGFANWLFVLIMFSGHLLWYYFAALRGEWSRAWLTGFAACALGFYLLGVLSLIFFLIPLVFMRRPLGIFSRLRERGVMFGIALLLLSALLWYLPYHFEGVKVALIYPRSSMLDMHDYLQHLLTFPVDMGIRLLPWALLAWAPFCVAFQTLDTTPMFSRFLRTIFLVNFFLLWITPIDDVYAWLILLPPLAIMTGLNYELAIRRYGNFFCKLANITAMVLLPGSAVVLLSFFLLPAEKLERILDVEYPLLYSDNFGFTVQGVAAGILLLLTALIIWRMRSKPPVWCYFLLLTTAPMLVYNCAVLPYRAQEQPRRDRAAVLSQALLQEEVPADTVLYKFELYNLFTESVYLQRQVQKINSYSELPKADQPVVYVLTGAFPNCPERSWRSLLAQPLPVRGLKVNLWRGQWQEKSAPERKRSPLLEEILQSSSRKGSNL